MDETERQRRREANRRYRERHKERLAAEAKARRAVDGEALREKEAAYREAHREEINARRRAWEREHREERRDALNQYQRSRHAADPARRLTYQRDYWAKQPASHHYARRADRQARLRGITERLDWRSLSDGPCTYCGTSERVTWDHVIPLSRGGRNHSSNLVRCCVPCNQLKSSMTPGEWRDPDRRFRALQRQREAVRRLLSERRTQYNAARREKRRARAAH